MGVFEYVSVLTPIVIGLGIAHLAQGCRSLRQSWHRAPNHTGAPGVFELRYDGLRSGSA